MARIRTIKPEFWTDEKIVALPFQARLLFIGLWNFADDMGALGFSPERIGMQIFPGDPDIDVSGLLDLLQVSDLIETWVNDTGEKAIRIANWAKHQKIDNPSKKTVICDGYKKVAIPSEARVAVARKYGCKPGESAAAECFYCGLPGEIQWWNGSRGNPTKWITLSNLEFDHFRSELTGGDSSSKNIVLACRACNRGKREFDALQFLVERNPSVILATPREHSSGDQGSRIKDQGRDQGPKISIPSESHSDAKPPEQVNLVFDHWRVIWGHPKAALDAKRCALISRALRAYPAQILCDAISGYRYSPHHTGQNDRQTVYDDIGLFLRDSAHIDAGLRFERSPPKLTSKLTQHNVAVLQNWKPPGAKNADSGCEQISSDDGLDGGSFLEGNIATVV